LKHFRIKIGLKTQAENSRKYSLKLSQKSEQGEKLLRVVRGKVREEIKVE